MSKGNWRDWVAAGLAAFLILVPLFAGLEQETKAQGDEQGSRESAYGVSPSSACAVYDTVEEVTTCQREEADLRAQRSMGNATWFAVWISGIALLGLGATVHFARKAWLAAKVSADADNAALELTRTQLAEARTEAEEQSRRARRQLVAMEESAKAAWANVTATQQISEKRARAYVHSIGASIKNWPVRNALAPDEKDLFFSLQVENFGQTIAKRINIVFCVAAGFRQETFKPRALENPVAQLVSNVAPGQTSDVSIIRLPTLKKIIKEIEDFNNEPGKPILSNRKYLHFWGEIHYFDIYGKMHRTAFQYVSKDWDIDVGPMISVTLDLPAFEEMPEQGDS